MGSGEIQSNLEIAGSLEIALGLASSVIIGGRALFGRGAFGLPNSDKLRMPINLTGVRTWVIRSVFERKQRPPAKVPKYMLSGKDVALRTTRMLA